MAIESLLSANNNQMGNLVFVLNTINRLNTCWPLIFNRLPKKKGELVEVLVLANKFGAGLKTKVPGKGIRSPVFGDVKRVRGR